MKINGSKFEYEKERNHDLMHAYHSLIELSSHICLPEIYKKVVNMPSLRFWVSEERAAVVISAMFRAKNINDVLRNMRKCKREMFREIYRRAVAMKKANPQMPLSEISMRVVRQPAPKFYLTPGSARVIIYKAKSEWYTTRRRKLRHLF